MITLSKSKLLKFAELSELQIDGRSEFAYTNRLEHFAKLVLSDLCMEHVPENEEHRQQLAAYSKAKEVATLTRQRDLAVEALEKQGHSAGCRKNAFGDICTCGLDDLLSTIKEIEAMAKGEQR